MKRIILASASPRRRELLEQTGILFEVITSDVEEITSEKVPSKMVEALSYMKGKAVADQIQENGIIIGADTIVSIDGKILGKPKDEDHAKIMLAKLQGHIHQVYTGVTIFSKEKNRLEAKTFSCKTDVSMFPMTTEEIEEYVKTGEPMDKAGAYGIQGRAAIYIRSIVGDYNNVVGLPIGELYHKLKDLI